MEAEPGMPLWLRFKFISEVALGMAVLHRHRPKPIIHHDLKPENILISKDDEAKIAEFGIATGTHSTTGVASTVASFGVAGTTPYMSPEKLQSIAGYQTLTSVDVYAWAIVAFETLTSEQAWPGMNKVQIMVQVVTQKQRPSIPRTLLPQLSEMIRSAWGGKRPSFNTLSELCCKLRTEIADLVPPSGSSGGVLTVVVSTSERAVNGEQVMEYVEAVAKLRDDLIFGYDWAGSSTGEVRDEGTVDWSDPDSVKHSFWFTSYKGQIKAEVKTLVQLSSVSKLVLLCIEGGPITQLEAATMRQLKDEVSADLRSKNVIANIAVEIVPFVAFKSRFPPRAAPLASLIPTYWKQGVPSEGKFLFQLHSTETQYKRAEAAFFQSAQSWRKVAAIYLVQHPSKWQAYSSKRRILDQDLRAKGLVHGANEKETFHGTRASSVPVILDQGFIREYNTVSAYGRGTYFARDASYSADDRYTPPDPQNGGLKSMFIVRILVGEPCVGRSGMQKPSPKQDGTLHESMVDNVANPSIFVLSSGSDDHAYPEFLVRFK
jgi:poly [ADP-ribose] polymerase 10/14/15